MRGKEYKRVEVRQRFFEYLGLSFVDYSKDGNMPKLKRRLNIGCRNFKQPSQKQTLTYLQNSLKRR